MGSLRNILWLGFKELRSLLSDTVMLVFVVYAFTLAIYSQATGTSNEVNNASIAFADEDSSALSKELFNAFYPPRFQLPDLISTTRGRGRDGPGQFMFVVTIPPQFEQRSARRPPPRHPGEHRRDRHAAGGHRRRLHQEHHQPAHRARSCRRTDADAAEPVNLVVRKMFNPNGVSAWFTERRGHHQPAHAADHRADGRRGHPRARARHARAPAGHAADRLRDRDGQGVGQRPGDPARDGGSLFLVVQMALKVPFAGLGPAVVRRRRALPVLRDGAGHVPRHDLAHRWRSSRC